MIIRRTHMRVPGFGNTDTDEHLDVAKQDGYFNQIVQYFSDREYEKGKTIRAETSTRSV